MAATPMMAQYLELKAEAGDALLFYRMGDFYELFFEDAVAAAAALDIALTKRGQHEGADVPMCGVPVHAAESYLTTLIRKGYRVAVCEQLEAPEEAKRRGSRALVRRGIVRTVTAGTLTEDALLEARTANHLAAWSEIRGDGALAWCDISTGALHVEPCPPERLPSAIARVGIREMLIADWRDPIDCEDAGVVLTPLPRSAFDSVSANSRLKSLFGTSSLDGFGEFERAELSALGALVEYVDLTQKGRLPHLRPPRREMDGTFMSIDAATRRSLELVRGPEGRRDGSLLEAVDRTVTAAGGRMLEAYLSAPLRDVDAICARLDAVSWAVDRPEVAGEIRKVLMRMPDMERAVQRLSLERGSPRDLAAVRDGLAVSEAVDAFFVQMARPPGMGPIVTDHMRDLRRHLTKTLMEEVPGSLSAGSVIAEGASEALDEARRLRDHGRGGIAALQAKYAAEAGVPSLKLKHNRVLGYFVECTASHRAAMEERADLFLHRQTMANAMRYGTLELADIERRIDGAAAEVEEIEAAIFAKLREMILNQASDVLHVADRVAEIDVITAKAALAVDGNWVRPCITPGRDLEIEGGRHPVVERALRRDGQPFVANPTSLTPSEADAAICLLTGPNMGGKSTWLRQNALIVVLAQMGCYVPAAAARIGIVSSLYSRVGASDDLARGRSTFMTEMVETAAILNQADASSLVILDEIGRGTSTYDGLSIAWATLEHLRDTNRCRALFATHFHELTSLGTGDDRVRLATMKVSENRQDIVFLHEITEGAVERSYGIHVARLAGLPPAAVRRAGELLDHHEGRARESATKFGSVEDLPLFASREDRCRCSNDGKELREFLDRLEVDNLTPRDALQTLYDMKDAVRGENVDVSRETPNHPRSELTPT